MKGLPMAAPATAGCAVRALGMTEGPVVADVKIGVEAAPGTGSALVGTTGDPGPGGGTEIEAAPAA